MELGEKLKNHRIEKGLSQERHTGRCAGFHQVCIAAVQHYLDGVQSAI
ncbi:hypothetical protein [Oscillibacter ruminantium]